MANETPLTVVGNLVGDPELRRTASGKPVCGINIASTPRVFDRNNNEWKDGDTLFLRGNIWDGAENAAASLTKGTRVIVQGNLVQRSYETREGEKRTSYELNVTEIGPSLRYAEATVRKLGRGEKPGQGGGGGNWGSAPQSQTAGAGAGAGSDDPWG